MPWDYSSPRTVGPGDRVRLELPHSEVCMHMRVAGRVMDVRMTEGRYPMAQLLNSDGSEFSFPIGTGEAGIFGDLDRGFYCYPEKDAASASKARPADETDVMAEDRSGAGGEPLVDPYLD
jgi:hypothetical protein